MQVELNSPTPEMTVLLHDPTSEAALPEEKGVRVLREPRTRVAEHARNVFVLVLATDLPEVSEFVSIANRRHQLRALFIKDDVSARWLPQFFERAGLRTLRNTLVHADVSVPKRVLAAWAHGAQDALIADASVVGDTLFVVSCALDRYEVAFSAMPALKSVPEVERTRFTVDEDGSYIHWPAPDVHVDLDAIRAAIDPVWHAKALAAKSTHDRRYGAAIAKLRRARRLKQSDIAGLSDRHVRRIERGQGTTHESLGRLAAAHGLELDDYLRELAEVVRQAEPDDHGPGGAVRTLPGAARA
jgi:hypothetical protein